MENILIAVGVISLIVLGATQILKQMVSNKKYLPVANVVIGVVIGVAYAVTIVKGDLAIYAWAGIIAGMSAGGFYDLGANVKGIANQANSNSLIKDGKGLQDNQEGE